MFLQRFIVLSLVFNLAWTAQNFDVVDDNWSSESSEEVQSNNKPQTPAPSITQVRPIPPSSVISGSYPNAVKVTEVSSVEGGNRREEHNSDEYSYEYTSEEVTEPEGPSPPITQVVEPVYTEEVVEPETEEVFEPETEEVVVPKAKEKQPLRPKSVEETNSENQYEYTYEIIYSYSTSEEDIDIYPNPSPNPPGPGSKPNQNSTTGTNNGTHKYDYNYVDVTQPDSVPLKVPFVPISGPNVHAGTILKPGGFNGLKPQEKPKQVIALPYESWAKSPLSMAKKEKA